MRRRAARLFTIALLSCPLGAQTVSQYRVFWVDTFNTALNNHVDIAAVVNNARAAKANAILAQVRRRGDAWYLNSLEPPPDFLPIASDFDALGDLITTAHAQGIEVHAFCIIGAAWNKNPTFAPTATLGPPTNPNHVFNLHGGYDPVAKTVVPGPNNWLTRTLLPDAPVNPTITFQGHRFGNDFWIDLGHPGAAQYTYDVLMQLVRNYDIDGVHLDRIRYPELSVSGQTPSTGTNIGYNPTSIDRFQRRNGIASGSPAPLPGDPAWSQWRRDQVTNFVRRVYLNAIAIKPQIKISAALIVFGGGPSNGDWRNAEAYWRVYQDWRAWTEEGILDMAIPMVYKREHNITTEQLQFDQWAEWLKNHQYNRTGLLGIGGLSNAIEGTLRQTRRAFQPSSTGNNIPGVTFYSMATSNVALTANPYSVPPGLTTPARSFAEFASGLTTGKSADGATLYEPVSAGPAVFANTATVPLFAWKASPARGHLMGFARRPDGTAVDSGTVTIQKDGTTIRTTATDGNGFFGAVDLAPGSYLAKVESGVEVYYSCIAEVVAGAVAPADAGFDPPPQITAPADIVASMDQGACTATVNAGSAAVSDNCGGYRMTSTRSDGAEMNAPYSKGVTTIEWKVTDVAGQTAVATQKVTVVDSEEPVTGECENEQGRVVACESQNRARQGVLRRYRKRRCGRDVARRDEQ